MQFRWNKAKAAENLRRHGVSFQEATTVFRDPLAITVSDETHSDFELRYWNVGLSDIHRLLIVVYTQPTDDLIRIISVRLPLLHERRLYENENLT